MIEKIISMMHELTEEELLQLCDIVTDEFIARKKKELDNADVHN